MSNKILVTGASGNIGSNIVKELNKSGADFYQAVTSKNKQDLSAKKIFVDYSNKESLAEAFKEMDTLFLLFPMIEPMVGFAKNAVTAAKHSGIKHIVRSSGAGANSSLDLKMPKIQGTIDELIINSGLDYTLTKPASFMQNFVSFYASDIKNSIVFSSTGQGKVGWTDVRDIAAVNATVLQNPKTYSNQELTITGPENLSFGEAVDIISKTIGREVNYIDVAEKSAIDAMEGMGLPQFIIEMTSSLNKIIKAGHAEGVTDTVESITGRRPITFNQFALDNKRYWS